VVLPFALTYRVPWLPFPWEGTEVAVQLLRPCGASRLSQELGTLHPFNIVHLCTSVKRLFGGGRIVGFELEVENHEPDTHVVLFTTGIFAGHNNVSILEAGQHFPGLLFSGAAWEGRGGNTGLRTSGGWATSCPENRTAPFEETGSGPRFDQSEAHPASISERTHLKYSGNVNDVMACLISPMMSRYRRTLWRVAKDA